MRRGGTRGRRRCAAIGRRTVPPMVPACCLHRAPSAAGTSPQKPSTGVATLRARSVAARVLPSAGESRIKSASSLPREHLVYEDALAMVLELRRRNLGPRRALHPQPPTGPAPAPRARPPGPIMRIGRGAAPSRRKGRVVPGYGSTPPAHRSRAQPASRVTNRRGKVVVRACHALLHDASHRWQLDRLVR